MLHSTVTCMLGMAAPSLLLTTVTRALQLTLLFNGLGVVVMDEIVINCRTTGGSRHGGGTARKPVLQHGFKLRCMGQSA